MDYTKPVMSLLHKLQQKNVAITHIYSGEQWERIQPGSKLKVRKDAAEVITSVDESRVYIKHNGITGKLYIVLGNDFNEILCDYSCEDETLENIIDEVSEDFYIQWES